jgi:hypothetical protein
LALKAIKLLGSPCVINVGEKYGSDWSECEMKPSIISICNKNIKKNTYGKIMRVIATNNIEQSRMK